MTEQPQTRGVIGCAVGCTAGCLACVVDNAMIILDTATGGSALTAAASR